VVTRAVFAVVQDEGGAVGGPVVRRLVAATDRHRRGRRARQISGARPRS